MPTRYSPGSCEMACPTPRCSSALCPPLSRRHAPEPTTAWCARMERWWTCCGKTVTRSLRRVLNCSGTTWRRRTSFHCFAVLDGQLLQRRSHREDLRPALTCAERWVTSLADRNNPLKQNRSCAPSSASPSELKLFHRLINRACWPLLGRLRGWHLSVCLAILLCGCRSAAHDRSLELKPEPALDSIAEAFDRYPGGRAQRASRKPGVSRVPGSADSSRGVFPESERYRRRIRQRGLSTRDGSLHLGRPCRP